MNIYEKPIVDISKFNVEESIMASNVNIADENLDPGWGDLN